MRRLTTTTRCLKRATRETRRRVGSIPRADSVRHACRLQSKHADKAPWVETGRAYERSALQATALDIRNAFINQPIEVPSLRPQFERWLTLNGEHALLLVRFGRGPIAPFRPRRPLDAVMTDDQPESRMAAARAS